MDSVLNVFSHTSTQTIINMLDFSCPDAREGFVAESSPPPKPPSQSDSEYCASDQHQEQEGEADTDPNLVNRARLLTPGSR